MVSHWHVKYPTPFFLPKLVKDGRIAMWDWVSDEFGGGVQWDKVDTETPYELIDAMDVLLVWFRCEKCLEHPFTLCGLHNVSNLG